MAATATATVAAIAPPRGGGVPRRDCKVPLPVPGLDGGRAVGTAGDLDADRDAGGRSDESSGSHSDVLLTRETGRKKKAGTLPCFWALLPLGTCGMARGSGRRDGGSGGSRQDGGDGSRRRAGTGASGRGKAARVAARGREREELARLATAVAAIPPLRALYDATAVTVGGGGGLGGIAPAPPANRRQAKAARAAAAARATAGLDAGVGGDGVAGAAGGLAASAALASPIVAARHFSDLPLSERTVRGLAAAGFTVLSDIQRAAMPQALAGRDVLAAAPTGSGKTLAFAVPVLEALYRASWGPLDGLGAMVLAPTRELAAQIFDVFRAIGGRHELSAALVTGGHDVGYERERLGGINILVATPGRLLQHLDESAELVTTGVKVLVLDEADRILDMGFAPTVDAIVANLPRAPHRQTLLFSATQTKSVRALARLSLSKPEYVEVLGRHSLSKKRAAAAAADGRSADPAADVDAGADAAADGMPAPPLRGGGADGTADADGAAGATATVGTPHKLVHTYALVTASTKLSTVWSFIKSHLKAKTLIFLATCKQVRFVYEAFRRLRPGVPLLALHGRMSPGARADTYARFSAARGGAALFATDVAARGLDFPAVTWVLQADCPADVGAYVHRAGRTARYRSAGTSLMLLVGGREEGMVTALAAAAGVVATRTRINPSRLADVTPRLASAVAADGELRALAQGALKSYVRAVGVAAAAVGDVGEEEIRAMAAAYGLPAAPVIRTRALKSSTVPTDAAAAAAPAAPSDHLPGVVGMAPAVAAAAAGRNVYGYRVAPNEAPGAGAATLATATRKSAPPDDSDGDDSDSSSDRVLAVKRVHSAVDSGGRAGGTNSSINSDDVAALAAAAGRRPKRLKISRTSGAATSDGGGAASRLVFDPDGRAVRPLEALLSTMGSGDLGDDDKGTTDDGPAPPVDAAAAADARAARVARALAASAAEDRAVERERVRALHRARRDKERRRRAGGGAAATEVEVTLAGGTDDDDGSGDDSAGDPDGGEGDADDVADAEAAALAILNARRRR
ncbi:hypothetical protein MMPV_008277 [Pyropia vietnamensis]